MAEAYFVYVAIAATAAAAAALMTAMYSKGGKQNNRNEYVRAIQALNCPRGDICDELRKWYKQEANSIERLKIKEAMKYYNCDGKDRFQ